MANCKMIAICNQRGSVGSQTDRYDQRAQDDPHKDIHQAEDDLLWKLVWQTQ